MGSNFAMENVQCVGNETKLSSCEHKKENTCFRLVAIVKIIFLQQLFFSHEAAGVICSRKSVGVPRDCYTDDKVCLVGGKSASSGNVYIAGHPVCHNGWDYAEANVVCRSLGFIGASDFTIKSFFGVSDTYFIINDSQSTYNMKH